MGCLKGLCSAKRASVALYVLVVLLGAAQARTLGGAAAGDTKEASKLEQSWRSNKQLEAWSKEFISRCGSIAKIHNVGSSVKGVPLWFLEISDHPGVDEPEPNFKYIANMHGNEISGRMLLPRLAEWLCANNGKDARAMALVRDFHLFLMPTMNPDGYPRRRNNRGKGAPGGAGYDLNRNFPDQWKDKGADLTKPAAGTQPEVAAVMAFSLTRNWLAGANFHEGDMLVNYPWDGNPAGSLDSNYYNAAPDDVTFKHLAAAYAKLNPGMAHGSYPDGITNGNAWYPVFGGMQDWDYINAGCIHFTIECSTQQGPPPSKIPTLWDQNLDALLQLPLAAYQGVRGTVKDAATGKPLAATLVVKTSPSAADPSAAPIPFRASPAFGFYARPLAPGANYTLVASMPGFDDSEAVVYVPGGAGVVQDFELRRSA